MKILDILRPHRLFINQSLRKESEKLRVHIDEYKKRYDVQYQRIIEELDIEKGRLNSQFEQSKTEVLQVLSSDVEAMQVIGNTITVYVTTYFDRQLAYKQKEAITVQLRIVEEYADFLSDQMNKIGEEIDTLRTRIDLLSRKADIADILRLVQLSGSVVPIEEIHDAKQLLDAINHQVGITNEDNQIVRSSLLHVKRVLEERVSFLAEIQYFAWVIEQKIQLSKELRSWRDEQYILQKDLLVEIEQIQRVIVEYNSILWNKAKEIRFYWAKPIVFIGAEIEDSYSRIKELEEDVEEHSEKIDALKYDIEHVQQSIDQMKDEKSNDSFKWERLQQEKRSLINDKKNALSQKNVIKAEIGSLYASINTLKEKRKNWHAKRKTIQDLLGKNYAPLMKISDNNQRDDAVYANMRLRELEQIENEGRKAAEDDYQREYQEIIDKRDAITMERDIALSEIESRRKKMITEREARVEKLETEKQLAQGEIQLRINSLKSNLSSLQKDLALAKKKLQEAQAADTRFFFVRLLSDSPAITKAKEIIASLHARIQAEEREIARLEQQITSGDYSDFSSVVQAQEEVESIQATIDSITSELEDTKQLYNKQISDCEKQMLSLRPRPDRPTAEERSEMSKIRTWQASQRKRAKNERSNVGDC